MSIIDPRKNYEETREEIGYVVRKKATLNDYKRIGFKSGLEVHQQLLTRNKLFCRCPAGIYHDDNDFDAEVIRHMRPLYRGSPFQRQRYPHHALQDARGA